MRLPQYMKLFFYAVSITLYISGVFWWGIHMLFPIQLSELDHRFSILAMQIHGAVAMMMLVILGWMIPIHIQAGFKLKLNRKSGIGMLVVLGVLALTGYALYYAGLEWMRNISIWIHIGVGVVFPVILASHIWMGRYHKRLR